MVFLIASHTNPAQVARLVRRIASDLPGCGIVVHHDQSKSILERDALPLERIELIDDFIAAEWGGSGLVELAVRGLQRATHAFPAYRFVVFLSGQDYPLRSLRDLPAALEGLGDGVLHVEDPTYAELLRYQLTWFRIPRAWQTPAMVGLFERLIYRFNHRQKFVRFAAGRLGCALGLALPTPRPRGWRVVQGNQWWVLGRTAVQHLMASIARNRTYYEWFLKRTIVPDEAVFQTFLLNDASLHFGDSDIRMIRWDDRRSGSPAVFGLRDLAELERSEKFFARKFDANADGAILDALDARAEGA